MKPKHHLSAGKTMLACLLSGAIFFASCQKEKSVDEDLVTDQPTETVTDADSTTVSATATQAIEGFGAGAVGGANSSTVYHVTNLNSSGSGSLAAGIGSNRTIVFDVSGTIPGRFIISNVSYLTIDATGQNITIDNNNNGDAISIDGSNTHHIILKGLHVTDAGNDGINVVSGAHDIAITNCTSYGNRDGNIDIADGYNVTVQYCIMGGGASGWSGAMLITARSVSVHHNIISPSTTNEVGERCPLIHCNYSTVGSPNADFRNNLVWKWGRNAGSGSGYGTSVAYNATANVVNNYYYSSASASSAVNADDGYGSGATGKLYASGNVSGNSGVNANSDNNHALYTIPTANAITTQDACTAAALALANAGPSPRNSTDNSILSTITLPGCSTTTPPPNQAPTVSAGAAQTITLPTSSVTLTGTASDADGSIASYAWTKTSGGAATISSPSARITTVTGLVAGTYVFNLRVTDNAGASANSSVTITVNGTTTNQPPVVSVGSAQTITLPISSVTLTGTASDPNGTIASYLWTKVSGGAAVITSPASNSTSVTGLVAGTYVFNLRVTDNGGATANANVTVTVNSSSTTPPPTYGTLVYSQGYDASSSVNTTNGRNNSMSTSLYKTGPGSFRTEVKASESGYSNGYRGEMIYSGTTYNPTEAVIEYDVYYQNWASAGGGGSTIMWQPSTSGASAVVGLQNYDGKFKVVRAIGSTVTPQSGTLRTVTPNTWYKMRWEVKWSSTSTGYIRLYIDNVLYYSFTGQTTDASGAPTLRLGQFRWSMPSGNNTVVHYDNLKIYRK